MADPKAEIELQGQVLGQKARAKLSGSTTWTGAVVFVLAVAWGLALYNFDPNGSTPSENARLLMLIVGTSLALGVGLGLLARSQRIDDLLNLVEEKNDEIDRLSDEKKTLQALRNPKSSGQQKVK